jgi:hypothetical protein
VLRAVVGAGLSRGTRVALVLRPAPRPGVAQATAAAVVRVLLPALQSSLGQQPDSTVPNPGSMTFGTSARLIKYGTSGVPGPGERPGCSSSDGAACCQQHSRALHACCVCVCLCVCTVCNSGPGGVQLNGRAWRCSPCCMQATTACHQRWVSRRRAGARHARAPCLAQRHATAPQCG